MGRPSQSDASADQRLEIADRPVARAKATGRTWHNFDKSFLRRSWIVRFAAEDRKHCRECRAKLPEEDGTERHQGFCCRGCWERYYRKHCAARGCEKAMPRKAEGSILQYCSRKCRNEARRFKPFSWPSRQHPRRGTETVGSPIRNADSTGTFSRLDLLARAWRIELRAGPERKVVGPDGVRAWVSTVPRRKRQ
jgi:hypothetical protein